MARARRPHNLEAKLEANSAAIIAEPQRLRGNWRSLMPHAREIRLDLGCGKGSFLAEAAQKEPDVLFVGIDISPICVANAALALVSKNITNAFVCEADAHKLREFFAIKELQYVYLNFSAPFPKAKNAKKRLTHLDFLMTYRQLVGETGTVEMRTDNVLFWEFSLRQFEIAGYSILQQTSNLHRDAACFDTVLTSEYNTRATRDGVPVYALRAQPGPEPEHVEQCAPLGLLAYLPEDVEHFDQIPYGMEDAIANIVHQRANTARRALRHASSAK